MLLGVALDGWWSYLLLAGVAVLPLVPSEAAVIAGGVLAAHGDLDLPLVILAAAAGSLLGDLLSFLGGRALGARALRAGRLERGGSAPRRLPASDWVRRQLEHSHGRAIIVARFVPGGRTAAAVSSGLLRIDSRRFVAAVGTGAALWAVLNGALGFFTGMAAAEPGYGLMLGLGVAVVAATAATLWSRVQQGPARRCRGQSWTP